MTDGNNIEKAFGQVIRELRLERGLSQEKLSELCNLDRSYVSEIERGEKTASIRTIMKIALGLDLKPSLLIKEMEKLI